MVFFKKKLHLGCQNFVNMTKNLKTLKSIGMQKVLIIFFKIKTS